ncbi:hypothetical protein HED55_01015 [Ochrobactrum haematophilum]|uniref:Uncharacterized protein n=1 Tax=Brucella haematophila TaxID=419474 RepID=A0ABX1DLJ2_9HYPH|nr:hypothetical protein [Brucella haematophila]
MPTPLLDAGNICERPFGFRNNLLGVGGFRRDDDAHGTSQYVTALADVPYKSHIMLTSRETVTIS